MSEPRPMFDDETLPAWLVRAGFTYAGHTAPAEEDIPWLEDEVEQAAAMGGNRPDRVPWRGDDPFAATLVAPADPPPWMSAFTPPADAAPPEPPPWFEQTVHLEQMGEVQLDWLAPGMPDAAPPEGALGRESGGVTGYLPWRQEGDQPPQAAASASGAGGEDDWLSDAGDSGPLPWDSEGITPEGMPTPGAQGSVQGSMTGYLPWRQEPGPPGESAQSPASSPASVEPLPWDTVESAERAEPTQAAQPGTGPTTGPTSDDDWLRSFGLMDDDQESQPPAPTSAAAQATPAAQEELTWDVDPFGQPAAEDALPWDLEPETPAPTSDFPQAAPDTEALMPWDLEPETLGQSADPSAGSSMSKGDLDWLDSALFSELNEPETPPAAPPATLSPAASVPPSVPADLMAELGFGEGDEPGDLAFGGLEATPAQPAAEPALDLPDWFADIGEPAQPAAEEPEPDWLSAPVARTITGSLSTELPPPVATSEPEAPPAKQVRPPDTTAPAAPPARPPRQPAPAALPAEDVPGWLRDMTPVDPAGPTVPIAGQTPPSAPSMDLVGDDWLKELNSAMPESSDTLPKRPTDPIRPGKTGALATPSPAQEALPRRTDEFNVEDLDLDALLNLSDEPAPPSPVSTGVLRATPVDFDAPLPYDLDAVLAEARPAEPTPPSAPSTPSRPAAPVLDDAEFDAQLAELAEQAAPAPEAPAAGSAVPTWIDELRPAGPVELHIGDQTVRVEEVPLGTLPGPIRQLRETLRELPLELPEGESAETNGPLTGIAGALGPVGDVLRPEVRPAIVGQTVSEAQSRGVALLRTLLSAQENILRRRTLEESVREAEEGAPTKTVAPVARARFKFDRILITLLLALAVLLPFFSDALNLFAVPSAANSLPEARERLAAVRGTLQRIPDGQSVLVAFEYGPTASGELDELARAILSDMLRRNMRPILVSTNPSGAMHAQGLITRLAEEIRPGAKARQDYVVLGYLPGGAGGVRTLASALLSPGFERQVLFSTDIEGNASGLNDTLIGGLRVYPAFVLAETQDDVRNWAEQFSEPKRDPRFTPTIETFPLRIALLSSVSASAAARAYADGQRIIGPLIGLRDALLYREASGQYTDAAQLTQDSRRWQSIGLASLLAGLIILVGTAVNLIRSLPGRRKR